MISFILTVANKIMRRSPDRMIGGPDDPYMLRWFVIPRNRWFNLYLNEFHRDDDDRAMHDHPWISLSLCLRGYMRERRKDGSSRTIKVGSIVYRSAKFAHRIEILEGPAVTLFFTGPKFREWGFHCPQGWRHWKDFTSGDDGETVGAGCA